MQKRIWFTAPRLLRSGDVAQVALILRAPIPQQCARDRVRASPTAAGHSAHTLSPALEGMQPEPPKPPPVGLREVRQVAMYTFLSLGQCHHGLGARQGMSR